MARIHPSGWRELQATGSFQREIETLHMLAERLPAEYDVYHGVHWTRLQGTATAFGEIDFVIVAPNARVMLIEQKAGFLEETESGLQKLYRDQKKNIAAQIARSIEALQARYAHGYGGHRLALDYLLYCPDYTVAKPHIAGIEPARIVDAQRRNDLPDVIATALGTADMEDARAASVRRFFEGVLELTPEIGAVSEEARALYSRISGGLATWGRRLELDPFRLRVIGTAGSGKTQLALGALRDAAAAGRRALYVCYNRPLADHLRQVAPSEATVLTYHQLCDRVVRSLGTTPDFAQPNAFRQLEAEFARSRPGDPWRFDEIVVDEGQDFKPEWVEPLLGLLRAGGRAWWLEDPLQNLYGRDPVALPGWAVLRSDTNYRSPRDILTSLNRMLSLGESITAGSPLSGSEVEIESYSSTSELLEHTKLAITRCIRTGFKRDLITVLSYRGRENSALSPFDKLGTYTLRRFTGAYDAQGAPQYTPGDVTLETVLRFKGQSSPAVIFTEIDFETLDDKAIRRIFVGATRATMKLILIVSDRAAKVLLERLGSG